MYVWRWIDPMLYNWSSQTRWATRWAIRALVAKVHPTKLCDVAQMAIFCVIFASFFQRAACSTFIIVKTVVFCACFICFFSEPGGSQVLSQWNHGVHGMAQRHQLGFYAVYRLQKVGDHKMLLSTSRNYTVSQKSPSFTTCYNFYVHSSIATVFGTNVAEKVDN